MTYYFDACSTVPMRKEAVEAYVDTAGRFFGNPSSSHGVGAQAKSILEETREGFAELLGCGPREIFFTSGGTESANTLVESFRNLGTTLVSTIEHHAILDPAFRIGAQQMPVQGDGVIDFNAAKLAIKELSPSLSAVFLMAVNNETGVLQPIDHVGTYLKRVNPDAKVIVDAVQAPHWMRLDNLLRFADGAFLAAHKFAGPKGFGLMMARNPSWLRPLLYGGGQESERRSGTQDVASAVAALVALRLAQDEVENRSARAAHLRDVMRNRLAELGDRVTFTGDSAHTVPGVVSLIIPGVRSEEILFLLDAEGVCASAGSACASGALDPSHVLLAMGYSRELAGSSLRLSFTGDESEDEVRFVADAVKAIAGRLCP